MRAFILQHILKVCRKKNSRKISFPYVSLRCCLWLSKSSWRTRKRYECKSRKQNEVHSTLEKLISTNSGDSREAILFINRSPYSPSHGTFITGVTLWVGNKVNIFQISRGFICVCKKFRSLAFSGKHKKQLKKNEEKIGTTTHYLPSYK